MTDENGTDPLKQFQSKVPAVKGKIGSGLLDDGCWWVKFRINIEHRLAWHVVQELGYVLNYPSLEERLPGFSTVISEWRPERFLVVGY